MLPSKKLINSEDLKRYSLGSKSGFLKKCILMYSMFSTLIEIEEVYEIKEMTICGSPQTHPYNTLQHPGGKKILQVKNPFVPSPAKMPFFSSSSFRTCTPPGPNPCAASLFFSCSRTAPSIWSWRKKERNPKENTGKIKHVEPSGVTRMLPSGVISALQVA